MRVLRIAFLLGAWAVFTLLCTALRAQAQSVTSGEYFIDHDPGYGMATPLFFTPDVSVNLNEWVDSSTLTPGHHTLYLRVQDDAGNWGMTESQPLYINPLSASTSVPNLTAVEYFIDHDPGYGMGTLLSVSEAEQLDIEAAVASAGLMPGAHTLFLRSQNANGTWGMAEAQVFWVSEAVSESTTPPNLTAAEYFIDHDPGYGMGTSLSVSEAEQLDIEAAVASAGLTPGVHHFFLRTQNVDGTWGMAQSQALYVRDEITSNAASLNGWEYFFDVDPGVGMGTFIPASTSETLDIETIISTEDLSNGQHVLGIRARNENGVYGLRSIQTFEVLECSENLLPLGDPQEICSGSTLELEAASGYDFYFWSTGESTQSITTGSEGLYHYSVLDTTNVACYHSDSIAVNVVLPPVSDFSYEVDYTLVSFDNLEAEQNVVWYFGDGTASLANNPAHAYPSSGVYDVLLVTSNACGESQTEASVFVCSEHPSPPTWYQDADNDGFGDATVTQVACEQPVGFTSNADDCDDTNSSIYPEAPGTAEGIDNNCNGWIDYTELLPTCPPDLDGDGTISTPDILIILGAFGCAADCPVGDLDEDGQITTPDLLIVLGYFGTTCPE